MDYKEKYEQGLECIQEILSSGQEKIKMTLLKERLLPFFPELESEDEKIRKKCINFLNLHKRFHASSAEIDDCIAWLEKQKEIDKEIVFRPLAGTDIITAARQALEKIEIGKEVVLAFNGAYIPVNGKTVAEICNEYFAWTEKQGEKKVSSVDFNAKDWYVSKVDGKIHNINISSEKQGEKKPIMNVPSREVILAIWDLGNEWKELTNGSISTEYGTQLDYIQKHWHESEYYLREKQGEKKHVNDTDEGIVEAVKDTSILDMVEPKFKVGDVMRTLQEADDGIVDGMPVVISIDKEYYHCTNELIAIKDQDDYEFPPINVKQKATWSEDDEEILKNLIDYFSLDDGLRLPTEETIDWLKSLKERLL